MLKLKQDDVATLYFHGLVLNSLSRYKEALNSFDKVIEIKPTSYGFLWHYRGLALFQLKRYKEAAASFQEHLKIDNNAQISSGTWYFLGHSFLNLKEYEESLEAYNQAVKIYPDYSIAWMERGVVLHYLQQYDDAIESYKQAIKINPDYTLAKENLQIAKDTKKYENGKIPIIGPLLDLFD